MYEIILIKNDKADFRFLKQNIRVLDKYWCIGQNPWVLDQIFGSLNKSLVLDKIYGSFFYILLILFFSQK